VVNTTHTLTAVFRALASICSDSYTLLSRLLTLQYLHSQLEKPVVCCAHSQGASHVRTHQSHTGICFPDSPLRRCLSELREHRSHPPPTPPTATSMVSQYRGHSAVDSILTQPPSPSPSVRSSWLYDVLPSTHHSSTLNPVLYLEDLVTHIVGLEQNLGLHNPWT